jgi:sporulation protein YlmC with PRC-barrel domain
MDMPIGAKVYCQDELCGRSTRVVINPTTQRVTHIVVEEEAFPNSQRLVEAAQISQAGPREIHLRCTKTELERMENFFEVEYVPGVVPFASYGPQEYVLSPYVLPNALLPLEHERVPPGELAVRRGTRVEATDGAVGRVDEFLVDPATEHITHLVLREGHLWGQRDVTIPVGQIARIDRDTVYLKLDKAGVAVLPQIPIKR